MAFFAVAADFALGRLIGGDEGHRLENEARTAGADDWLPKPAPPEELIRRLHALLGVAVS